MSPLDVRNDRKALSVAAFLAALVILGGAAASASADFLSVSPTGSDAGNDCRFHPPELTPCATIQHAVDEAGSYDWVSIDPGLYDEEVVVDKPGLTLIGDGGPGRPAAEQAVIDGDSGVAIRLEAAKIFLRQLKIVAGPAGTPILASGADIDELWAHENIISGGSSGVRLEADGEDVSVGHNQIENVGDGIRVSGADFPDLTIQWNQFTSIDGYAVRADDSSTIEGLRLEGNELPAPTRIAGLVEERPGHENDITENTFESTRGAQLAINGLEARVMRNTFEGHGAIGCLQILGSQGGMTPSSNILVSLENEFVECKPYGIELGPGVDHVAIRGNVFPGTYVGVVASDASPWNVTGRVRIEGNRIVGTTHRGVVNQASGVLGARGNWWGCNAGPGSGGCDSVSPGVDSSDAVRLAALIGPRTEDDGIIELPTGTSIALDPGDEAEVAAMLTSDGSWPTLGVPTEGIPVRFSSSMGTLNWATNGLQNGYTINLFTAGSALGSGSIVVSMDNQDILVPVRVGEVPATAAPSPTPINAQRAPTLAVGKRARLAGRQATIGSVACADTCLVAPSRARIVIGDRTYRGRVAPRGTLAAGSTTPIRVTLPRPALRALEALRGSAKVRIRVKVTVREPAGQTAARAISVTIRR